MKALVPRMPCVYVRSPVESAHQQMYWNKIKAFKREEHCEVLLQRGSER